MRDIRLAMSPIDAWALATSDKQQTRLGGLLFGRNSPDDLPARDGIYKFLVTRGHPRPTIVERWNSPGGDTGVLVDIEYADWVKEQYVACPMHERVKAGVAVLERIGTPAAHKHLRALAGGHANAIATIEAKAAGERQVKAAPAVLNFAEVWKKTDPELFEVSSFVNPFLDRPKEAVAFFKDKLKPTKLSKADGEKLLARLFGDDLKECRAAIREIQFYDLRLAMSVEDAWALAKTATQRGRLITACGYRVAFPQTVIGDDYDPDAEHRFKDFSYHLSIPDFNGSYYSTFKRDGIPEAEFPANLDVGGKTRLDNTLAELTFARWHREESAVYILDAIGTDDVVAVIKDMATGHPDAGPTKAAKAVLKRRGGK